MTNNSLSGKKYFALNDDQRLNWLRLIRSQNVGPATFRDLISHYGTAELALEAIPELAKRGGAAAKIKVFSRDDAEREMALARHYGAHFLGIGEPEYPVNLRNAEGAPPLLCFRGSQNALKQQSLAIVGSRNSSIAGMKITERLSGQIGREGYIIVSGLARGIDTAAHKAALSTGTVAVFAGGVDHVFPPENMELASAILGNEGALVSEMPMGWQPRAKDFPRRNRIITGLAKAVLVVEAARKSGSLITARIANEMGRTVLAIPGSPLDPRSHGTNNLIREGATLVTSMEDIIEAISPLDGPGEDSENMVSEGENDIFEHDSYKKDDLPMEIREKIISALGPSPVLIDDILEFTGATPGELHLTLLELSLAGKLERHPGGLVSTIDI
ncbi:MAG: DNA-processing protein DprA [Pseudomonadota bacterium]